MTTPLAYEIAVQLIHGGMFFDQDKPLPSADDMARMIDHVINKNGWTPLARATMPKLSEEEIMRRSKRS